MLTETEVLSQLADAGFEIPRSRFETWRERGLLPKGAARPGRGGGLGRAPNLYPEMTIDQVKQILALRQQNLDLVEIGWRLWLAGHPVGRKCWFDVFQAVATEYDDEVAPTFREALNSDGLDEDSIQKLADQLSSAHTSYPLWRHVRKSLGPDRLSALVLHVASMAIGEFTTISTQTEGLRDEEEVPISTQLQDPRIKERQADLRTMDVALGLVHARSDTVNGAGPLISGDYSSILRGTFGPLADTTLCEFLKTVDPERLRTVTRDLSALTKSIEVASAEFDKALAKDAFGLGRAALMAKSDRKLQALFGLIWTLVQERSAEKFHDLGVMAQSFNAAALAARQSGLAHPSVGGSKGPTFRRGPTRKPKSKMA